MSEGNGGRYSGAEGDRITPVEAATSREILEELRGDSRYFREKLERVGQRVDETDYAIGGLTAEVVRYRQDADRQHLAHAAVLRSVGAGVKALAVEVQRLSAADAFRARQLQEGFDRVCALLHDVREQAESAQRGVRDSSHNLDEFGRELEKVKKHMKWPTAIVCIVGIAAYVTLAHWGSVPKEVSDAVAGVAMLVLAAMPEVIPNVLVRLGLKAAPQPAPAAVPAAPPSVKP